MPDQTTDQLTQALPHIKIARAALGEALAPKKDAQAAAHGRAWAATYLETLIQLIDWHSAQQKTDTKITDDLVLILCGEYLNQLMGGIPMSQGEFARPANMGLGDALSALDAPPCVALRSANTPERRARVAQTLLERGNTEIDTNPQDETLSLIRTQFRNFARDKITPHAHNWHMQDALIPLALIKELAALGVFGLTIPENYGGAGLGKEIMCVVSEELSRGYIGVGSLATRTDIAAELILQSGTPEQKQKILPRIADASLIPTAVFTEPDIGSDLAQLTTRAEKAEGGYRIYGAKTWITHASRADIMTLLVRTDPTSRDHKGLSMLLAEKPRGDAQDPFPADGMAGSEIGVIGYRGMREYNISFDGFFVRQDALLGGEEGLGFKQLMQSFESARIQTAARAIGVAQAASDMAFDYARERMQFGRAIYEFARVRDKIVFMLAEILAVRCLTYHAARCKQSGTRCDLEAGMAKLLAARVAWAAADNAVQIHGGNGFAMDYPISRILCDARILSIFEGAAEIQADVIARRLAEQSQIG